MCLTLLRCWQQEGFCVLATLLGSLIKLVRALSQLMHKWLVRHQEYTLISADLLSTLSVQFLDGSVWWNNSSGFTSITLNQVSAQKQLQSILVQNGELKGFQSEEISWEVNQPTTGSRHWHCPKITSVSTDSPSAVHCHGGRPVPSSSTSRIPCDSPRQHKADKSSTPFPSQNATDEAGKLTGLCSLLKILHSSTLLWEMILPSVVQCSGITQAEPQPTNPTTRQKCVFLREALQQEKNVHRHSTEEKGCETHTGIQMLCCKGYYRV